MKLKFANSSLINQNTNSRHRLVTQRIAYMMHCPLCSTAAHAKSSRYISKETKERYHQCTNINCSCTFKTHESLAGIIVCPGQVNKVSPHIHQEQQPLQLH